MLHRLMTLDSIEVKLIENFSFEMIIVTLVRNLATISLLKMIKFLTVTNVISIAGRVF